MFVSFLSQKGGTGKTTLALHSAAYMAARGYRTLLIDADPQSSAMAWLAARIDSGIGAPANLTITAISNGTITEQLKELSASYDRIVIDGPPRADRIARDVILASDLVIVPTRLSGFDVWAGDSITQTIEALRPIQSMAGKVPLDWFYLVNQKDARTAVGRVILKALEKGDGPVLDTHICARTALIEATSQGLTLFDFETSVGKARHEIEDLGAEIEALLLQRQQQRSAA